MRPTHYLAKYLTSGETLSLPFDKSHFDEAGVPFSPMAGMPQLEAYQLINRWNTSQSDQRIVYGI